MRRGAVRAVFAITLIGGGLFGLTRWSADKESIIGDGLASVVHEPRALEMTLKEIDEEWNFSEQTEIGFGFQRQVLGIEARDPFPTMEDAEDKINRLIDSYLRTEQDVALIGLLGNTRNFEPMGNFLIDAAEGQSRPHSVEVQVLDLDNWFQRIDLRLTLDEATTFWRCSWLMTYVDPIDATTTTGVGYFNITECSEPALSVAELPDRRGSAPYEFGARLGCNTDSFEHAEYPGSEDLDGFGTVDAAEESWWTTGDGSDRAYRSDLKREVESAGGHAEILYLDQAPKVQLLLRLSLTDDGWHLHSSEACATTTAVVSPETTVPDVPSVLDDGWGPLIVADFSGGDDALAGGTLSLSEDCVLLLSPEHPGRSMALVWPASNTSWSEFDLSIIFTASDRAARKLMDGDEVSFGGGGDRKAADANLPASVDDDFEWLSAPSDSCDFDEFWFVGEVVP